MIQLDRVTVVTDDTTILPAVSTAVPRGEVLVVRGRNGAGKSTLLRVLAGIVVPSSGIVRIAGEPVDERDRRFRRRVAAMIGLPPMAPDLTVRDHLSLVATTWRHDPAFGQDRVDEVLATLRLEGLVRRFPHELSSGQLQLFGMGLVLVRPFDVLLLDEPEQRLDAEHVESVVGELRSLHARGATIVVATHSQVVVDALPGRSLRLGPTA